MNKKTATYNASWSKSEERAGRCSATKIRHAASAIRRGAVLAYPTEAVWGLGCDPWNELAVQRLLQIKSRPLTKGLIVVASDLQQLDQLIAPLTQNLRATLEASWPGAITWLIPDPNGIFPEWIRGGKNCVAARVSNHPLVQALCQAWGEPLVSTSANQSGRSPCLTAFQVRRAFASRGTPKPDLVLNGALGGHAQPSEIRDLCSGEILRPA